MQKVMKRDLQKAAVKAINSFFILYKKNDLPKSKSFSFI